MARYVIIPRKKRVVRIYRLRKPQPLPVFQTPLVRCSWCFSPRLEYTTLKKCRVCGKWATTSFEEWRINNCYVDDGITNAPTLLT